MSPRTESRELALGGLLGAAALLLPTVFHLVHLGSLFMPMYAPLCLLAFLVSARIAASAALIVPLMSGLLTGMPPFYPPIAPVMSVEWPSCVEPSHLHVPDGHGATSGCFSFLFFWPDAFSTSSSCMQWQK